MAAFTDTKYESDAGTIHSIRLTSGYATAAGAAPSGAVNSNIKVKVTKTGREFGIRPRRVSLSRTVGTGDTAFRKRATLPVLTKTVFDGTTMAPGQTVTIGANTWTIVSKQPEDF